VQLALSFIISLYKYDRGELFLLQDISGISPIFITILNIPRRETLPAVSECCLFLAISFTAEAIKQESNFSIFLNYAFRLRALPNSFGEEKTDP